MISTQTALSFEEVGMHKVPIKSASPVFSPDSGDYIRFFSPHVIRKRGEVRMLGTFGLMFLPFEKFWQNNNSNRTLMISLYASNIDFLMNPPDLANSNKDMKSDWFSKIRLSLDLFPSSLAELLSEISRGKIGAFPLMAVMGDQTKFSAFLQWVTDRNLQASIGNGAGDKQ